MDDNKHYIIQSLIWAIVIVIVFGGGWLSLCYTITNSNQTSVQLKEIK